MFVLPFFFPPAHPALSAAYSSGFNNRVAAVAAALLALVTFAVVWRSRSTQHLALPERAPRIPPRSLAAALATCAVFTLAFGWVLTRGVVAYNDNLYFLEYMDEVTTYHLHIYRDFNFLYGPILLYFPVAVHALLSPFHIGLQGSYYVALTLMQLLGIVLLYYTLEALPLSRRSRTITLGLFTFCVLCPLMGLNYTLVRSLLPFSTLLFVTRLKRPIHVAALLFLGELLQLAVSPELGFAFAAGACFYALCRSVATSRWYLLALVAPPLAVVVFLRITGTIYLASMAKFSSGCLNLIVEPLPYILFFLFALVWLVPSMLGRMARQGSPDTIAMLSLFVVSLALVSAALGRCDPLHVIFNGAGVYLLAIVAISSWSARIRDLWFLVLALICVWTQAINAYLFIHPILHAGDVALLSSLEDERQYPWFVELQTIEHRVGNGKLSVPFGIPLLGEEELKRAGIFQPDRECFYIGVSDAPSENERAERMDQTEWALVYPGTRVMYETADTSRKVVGLGFHYPNRRPPYPYGQILFNDLAAHWTPVSKSPDWILYHNNRFGRVPPAR